ncbi:hypothetical protein C9374_010225 [Naegleria lovaniensis]|uniref:DH domain-containing protein n=1 Tax=Naegleria lovaniensis TaxID=51637 RepID=A0AA88GIP6_NAELO|nr:uncharacterized protein C9374_010225 [Naegleria lovaniensis]KAG2374851.1 hypothetical protein C9374_010225 [Naegleria lovaniensis]
MSVLPQPAVESKHHKSGQRLNIMKEILDTEKNYLTELELLEEYYAKPLKELIGKQKFITQPLYNKIFKGDLVIIRKTNSELYNELIENFEIERANKVPNKTFGQIFLQYAPFIKGYTRYFNEFDNINATLEDIRKNNKPLQLWLDTQRKEAQNKPLGGLLITPVQRVPRYKLLLTELVKYTSPYHKDYPMLTNALTQISEVATELNTKMRESQNRSRMYAIDLYLKGREKLIEMEPNKQIVQPGRLYSQEIPLHAVYSKKFNVNISHAVLILFNNMFILCKNLEPEKSTTLEEYDGRTIFNYEIFEFVFEPVLCDARLVEKQPDQYPFPWIIDIPSEEENRIEEVVNESGNNTPTSLSGSNNTPPPPPLSVQQTNRSYSVAASTTASTTTASTTAPNTTIGHDSTEKKTTKHNMNDLYIFKKPLFQLVSQHDVYTLQFNSVSEKLDGLRAVYDIIDEQFKDCKSKEKDQKRCPFLSYEKERIQLYSEKKVSLPKELNDGDTANQLFSTWNYLTQKDFPKIKSKKKIEELLSIVNDKICEEYKQKLNFIQTVEEQALGAYYAIADCVDADKSLFQLDFHVGDIFILWQKVKNGKKWLLVQKSGLNFSPMRKIQLLDELLPNNLKDMKSVMRKQQLAKKKKPKTPKQIISISDHYCKIEKELEADKMLEEIALELNFLSLLNSDTNLSNLENSGGKKTSEKDRAEFKNQIRKSVSPALIGANKDEYKQHADTLFYKHIFNVSQEKGQVGLVPTKALVELPNQTFKTLLTLMEKRDSIENRKVRNFSVIKKAQPQISNSSSERLGTSSSNTSSTTTPPTPQDQPNTSSSNNNNSTTTTTGALTSSSEPAAQDKKSKLFGIFKK